MRQFWRRYEVRIACLFVGLLAAYLVVAWRFHAPRGYYGTREQPRFADPWLARSDTILSGGLLYRDVFTATPPLTNYLLIPPSLVARWTGNVNPWSTLSFMLYFSVFNLLAAYLLLYMGASRADGFRAAVLYLLNPLTFGNAVLRRQDESILAFFWGLVLLLFLKRRHVMAAVALGASLLVKLTSAVLIPAAFLNSRDWRYLVVPMLVFLVVFSPFLALAGRDAMFWDFGQQDTEHPFQVGGVSLAALWNRWHDDRPVPVLWVSIAFAAGVLAVGAAVLWYRFGALEEVSILLAAVLLLTPKLHTGYYSLLALSLAPLVLRYRLVVGYLVFGGLAVVADFYKWPVEDFGAAFWLMVPVYLVLLGMTVRLWQARRPRWA